MKGSAKIRAQIVAMERPSTATLHMLASTLGARAEARSRVELEDLGDSTRIIWSADLRLSGLLADVGGGLVEAIVKDMVQKIFSNIRQNASAAGQL